MKTQTELRQNLKRFTGSPHIFKVSLLNTGYTEGIQYLAQQANCYWLITDVSTIGKRLMKKSYFVGINYIYLSEEEQRQTGYTAKVTYGHGNGKTFFTQGYEWTDFPLKSLKLFYIDDILLLPGEY